MEKEKILQSIISDVSVRQKLVKESHEAFCSIYLSHHITYPYAFFHKEMFRITEGYDQKLNVIMAFRGSGKSTILNLSNAIWSILGKNQKKFVVIISKSRLQSQAHFENIKSELEDNDLLKQDLGPFRASSTEWGAYAIELPLYKAKIMCVKSLQNIRGLKYKSKRPDLIICDDMEDIVTVQSFERNKMLYDWFLNEVMNIGDEKTNIIVLGNLLNQYSLMIRLKKLIMHNKLEGKYYSYPLLDNHNRILWPQRYSIKDVMNIRDNLPEKEEHELFSMFDREFRLNMSFIRDGVHKYIRYPITNTATQKEEFKITTPLWARGAITLNTKAIDDLDGWDGETVVPNVGQDY
ncbi:MAG: hypothetical protein WC847_00100 [Candidatus Paceibacterota bacterium]|jgi:hypothetical protein